MLKNINQTTLLLSIIVFSLFGCGGGADKLKLYPVTGKVTKGGEPVADVMVTLFSKSDDAPGLMAVSGTDGTFEVAMGNGDKGAPVGTYSIVLSDRQATEIDYANPGSAPEASKRIPKVLTDRATSDLLLEVKADGENTIDINLDR